MLSVESIERLFTEFNIKKKKKHNFKTNLKNKQKQQQKNAMHRSRLLPDP